MTPSFSFMNSLKFKVSHRVTHELTTRVLAIYMREFLDFDKEIIIDTFDDHTWKKFQYVEDDSTAEFFYFQDLLHSDIPTINMEVWRTADNREIFWSTVYESNSLSVTDIFRFGLYVPQIFNKNNIKFTYKHLMIGTDEYKSVKRDLFDLSGESYMQNIEWYTENITIPKLNVKNGVYNSKHCNSGSCAIILTSHFVDAHTLIRIVDAFNMTVKIYFLGDHFKKTIKDLNDVIVNNKSDKLFFVFHWTPSEIIDGNTIFSIVEMPTCEEMKRQNSNISCKFDPNTVSIFYNERLKFDAPEFENWLITVRFKSLMPLIDMYEERYSQINNAILYKKHEESIKKITNEAEINEDTRQRLEDIYNSIACDYLRNNTDYYNITSENTWLTGDIRKEIIIGGM